MIALVLIGSVNKTTSQSVQPHMNTCVCFVEFHFQYALLETTSERNIEQVKGCKLIPCWTDHFGLDNCRSMPTVSFTVNITVCNDVDIAGF